MMIFCLHALVIMYMKCGELWKEKELLDMHKSSNNVISSVALMPGYAKKAMENALNCLVDKCNDKCNERASF